MTIPLQCIVCVRSHDYDVREMLWPPCWRSENIAHVASCCILKALILERCVRFASSLAVPTTKRRIQTFGSVGCKKIVTNQGEENEILSTERRTRWLAAISRADLTENIFWNHTIEIHCTKYLKLYKVFKIVKVKTILHKERIITGI